MVAPIFQNQNGRHDGVVGSNGSSGTRHGFRSRVAGVSDNVILGELLQAPRHAIQENKDLNTLHVGRIYELAQKVQFKLQQDEQDDELPT